MIGNSAIKCKSQIEELIRDGLAESTDMFISRIIISPQSAIRNGRSTTCYTSDTVRRESHAVTKPVRSINVFDFNAADLGISEESIFIGYVLVGQYD